MMSKAKWFAVRKPSTGEIIATSANQIVPPKSAGPTTMLYYITRPPFPLAVLKGGLGTRLVQYMHEHCRTLAVVKLTMYTSKVKILV